MNSLLLLAQTDGWWKRLFDNALPPLVVFVVLFVLLWLRSKFPSGKLYREEKERHLRHMQKVEDLLERIAKAVERDE
jgi:hypothetical protein